MGYTYYRLMTMIPPDATITLGNVTDALEQRFSLIQSPPAINVQEKMCTLDWSNWQFRMYWEDEPHVEEESREIAKRFASGRADTERIASCNRRITTAADDDPNMDHFNHYVFVMEVLEAFEGIYVFDPNGGKFTDE